MKRFRTRRAGYRANFIRLEHAVPGRVAEGSGLQQIEGKISASRRGRSTGLAAAPRNVTVALDSACVGARLVVYESAAPTASLTADFGQVVPAQGARPVVVGRVLGSRGDGLGGARIAVGRPGAKRAAATATTADSGAFRVVLPVRCADYEISIEARAAGTTVRKSERRRLCPGDALPIDARVKTQGHFIWVPGPR